MRKEKTRPDAMQKEDLQDEGTDDGDMKRGASSETFTKNEHKDETNGREQSENKRKMI